MSEESKVRSAVIAALQPLLAFPVENTAAVGCPDVCCLVGWIELKIATRPARPGTRVAVVVRPSQRLWMRNWAAQGGSCWWLTRLRSSAAVGDLWTLHSGLDGAAHLGRWTETQMTDSALWCATRSDGVPGEELMRALLVSTMNPQRGR